MQEVESTLLRVEDLGQLVRLTEGPVEQLPNRPAGLRLPERLLAPIDELVDGEHRRHCTTDRSRSGSPTVTPVTITIEPMTVTIGAEVGGVDLADDLSDDTIEEIRQALLDWKVIFFRDQHRLDRASHVAFGRRFGDLEIHPITPKDQEQPEVFVIPAGGDFRAPDNWHSDVTWRPEPSLGSILRAVKLPPLGGDTLWADMGKAYDLLDDETKELIDDKKATHDYASAFGRNQPPEVQEKMRASTRPSSTRSCARIPRPAARRCT